MQIIESSAAIGSTPGASASKTVPGEPGLWIVLFGDLAVFSVFFVLYLRARGQQPELFAESQLRLNPTVGAVNTLVLLTSSLLVVMAVRAFRDDRLRTQSPTVLYAAVAVGSCFVVVKICEYGGKISAGIAPGTNEFFMYYYTMTGLHLLHVLIGLAVLLGLARSARNYPATSRHIGVVEAGGCFWHMVDLLWMVIFPLLFLVR